MNDRIEIKTPTWNATLIKRRNTYEERRSYYTLTRVYGAVNTFAPAELKAYDDAVSAQPTVDHRALRRAATTAARRGLVEALATLVPRFDVNFRDFDGTTSPNAETMKELRFSHKAGCSCGCSPGFIVQGDVLRVDGAHVDIWFDLPAPSVPKIDKKDLAQAVFFSLTEVDAIKRELGLEV